MQIEGVDTSNLIDSLNFEKPGVDIFGDEMVAKQIQEGVRNVSGFRQGAMLPPASDDLLVTEQLSHQLKQKAFNQGHDLLQLVKTNIGGTANLEESDDLVSFQGKQNTPDGRHIPTPAAMSLNAQMLTIHNQLRKAIKENS